MPGGLATGPAGGGLTGTYPNPELADHLHTGVPGDGGAISSTVADQSITSRKVDLTVSEVDVVTDETTTSTSYVDLATAGPAITLTPGVEQDHLLSIDAIRRPSNSSAGAMYSSVAIAGATALDIDGGSGNWDVNSYSSSGSRQILASAQASGAVHTAKYRCAAGTRSFANRRLVGVCI